MPWTFIKQVTEAGLTWDIYRDSKQENRWMVLPSDVDTVLSPDEFTDVWPYGCLARHLGEASRGFTVRFHQLSIMSVEPTPG